MKVEQRIWTRQKGWEAITSAERAEGSQLVLLFGAAHLLRNRQIVEALARRYPAAQFAGCSTAGEICRGRVTDDSLVATAIRFEDTRVNSAIACIDESSKSFQVGQDLAQKLLADDLVHMFVLSDGLAVNGTELAKGLSGRLPGHITVTGGLAGDGERFRETSVLSDGAVRSNTVIALGFYGRNLKVGSGSLGGWDPFGPERQITRSLGNELFEVDGYPVLALYEKYLGKHAEGLPATGLFFPLSLRTEDSDCGLVRTILSIDRQKRSMTFAGDMPEGAYARLMKANFDRLIDGAQGAARLSCESLGAGAPDLAIMVSCVGRKMVLQQRIEEEVECAMEILGEKAAVTGFYSYGELAPSARSMNCELHNQTMTITTFREEIPCTAS